MHSHVAHGSPYPILQRASQTFNHCTSRNTHTRQIVDTIKSQGPNQMLKSRFKKSLKPLALAAAISAAILTAISSTSKQFSKDTKSWLVPNSDTEGDGNAKPLNPGALVYIAQLAPDDCNTHSFGASIAKPSALGNSKYYNVTETKPLTSTQRGCLSPAAKHKIIFSEASPAYLTFGKLNNLIVTTPQNYKVYYRLGGPLGELAPAKELQ